MLAVDRPVHGLLLAAGRGDRFRAAGGADKLMSLLPEGRPVVLEALLRLQAALSPQGGMVYAVVPPGPHPLAALLGRHGARVVQSASSVRGMGASLAAGARQAAEDGALLVALGDMPGVRADTLLRLQQALRAGASIVQPVCAGRPGHPVGFAPKHLKALRVLDGDQGARQLVQAHQGELQRIEVDDRGILADIDTPEDLQAFGGPPVSATAPRSAG